MHVVAMMAGAIKRIGVNIAQLIHRRVAERFLRLRNFPVCE